MENGTEELSICLIYPNKAEIGMSNLGFQKIYSRLSSAGATADIAFLKEEEETPTSHFFNTPLANFDALAFSVTFEMDEINILKILRSAGIPLNSGEREKNYPLIFAGGVAVTLNPEPLSRFIDFFVLGDGETALDEIVNALKAANSGKRALLKNLSSVKGVYVPLLYDVEHDELGRILKRVAQDGVPEKVERLVNLNYGSEGMAELEGLHGTVFGDAFLIEAGKGCGQGCRFCATGFIYRPVRHVKADKLKEQAKEGLRSFNRIGIVGSAICEHPDIEETLEEIVSVNGEVTVSSLRIGLAGKRMFELLAKGGCKTSTVAPEAGSDNMRAVINKPISEEEILQTVKDSVSSGIPNLKAYFLIGIPGETDEDVEAIALLSRKMRDVFLDASRPFGRAGKITVSVNPLIPKPATPFQWEAMAPQPWIKKQIKLLNKAFRREPNLELKTESLKMAQAQALLSLGNRDAGDFLIDIFNGESWNAILKTEKAKNIFLRQKDINEVLPWDFIETGVKRDFLIREKEKATNGKTSPPCPPEMSGCIKCGLFKGVCSV